MSETIPEFWHTPTAEPPVEAQPLSRWVWLPAVLGSLILPKRFGARIGITSIGKIALVHAAIVSLSAPVAVLAAIALEGDLVSGLRWRDFTLSEVLRLPAVLAVNALRGWSAAGGPRGLITLAVRGTYVLLFLLAWLLMPLIAAGEPPIATF